MTPPPTTPTDGPERSSAGAVLVPGRPILLDLFCCQGGASRGYELAGFAPFGVDIEPQPRYPYPFHLGDALAVLDALAAGECVRFELPGGDHTDLVAADVAARHASPPCQAYTLAQRIQGNEHPDLVHPVRHRFERFGSPWVIENVEGAPLINPTRLCGAMFGLETYRHRIFESNASLIAPEHPEHNARTTKMGRRPVDGEYMHIVGNFSGVDRARGVMNMSWATREGLREAIPPAYTQYLGRQLIQHLQQAVA